MYFIETAYNEWKLKDAYDYYSKENKVNAIKYRMKKDLVSLKNQPNIKSKAKTEAEKLLSNIDKNWSKVIDSSSMNNTQSTGASSSAITTFSTSNTIINSSYGSSSQTIHNIQLNNKDTNRKRNRNIWEEDDESTDYKDEIDKLFQEIQDDTSNEVEEEPSPFFRDPNLQRTSLSSNRSTNMIIQGINLTNKFNAFKDYCLDNATTTGFMIESHAHHLLALSSIFLFKYNEHHDDLLKFFSESELSILNTELPKALIADNHKELKLTLSLAAALLGLMKDLKEGDRERKEIEHEIYNLKKDASQTDEYVLQALLNCINKLPTHTIVDPLGEIDLCVSYLDPVLSAIFTNFKDQTVLRWPNITTSESKVSNTNVNKRRRPDAISSFIYQHRFKEARSYGEVKTKEGRQDRHNIVKDLIRIGAFGKETLDNFNMYGNLLFQAVADNGLYLMLEIGVVKVPMSIDELPAFITELDTLVKVKYVYDNHCKRRDTPVDPSWQRDTLSSPSFRLYVDSHKDCKRPTPLIF